MSKWIDVNKELPNDGTYVIGYGITVHGDRMVMGGLFFRDGNFGDFDISYRTKIGVMAEWQKVEVTHWQPLPEPPIT